ncbi:hypothetical protein KIF24_06995 [Micromonospora sp. Llam7]|uniref:hypothetical protein n=1 Tax=Micromonospora tarapacensis TaxID=2835305 RepID=UPI001C838B13|nr:hypothetical protein [Micromonospora tarapacensis]MBX7265797.1 hypothetical protein [Micromonospora tarapacensis]
MLPGAFAVCLIVLAQLAGMAALLTAAASTEVELNHGQGLSCHYVDMPDQVPLDGIESRRFDQSWTWFPPGLTCRTEVADRTVTVREPTWKNMAGPLSALLACILVTAVATALAAPIGKSAWWRHHRILVAALMTAVQPLTAATALAAAALRAGV